MKMIQSAKLLGLGLTLVIAVAGSGCWGKRPVNTTNLPGSREGGGDASGGLTSGPGLTNDGFGQFGTPIADPSKYSNYNRNDEIFKSDAVHFAYDSATVRADDKSKISEVADHLKGDPTAAVEVQGNCDER